MNVADANVTPRISVCIPTFRRPALLARAIQSVLDNGIAEFEVVVSDDDSDPQIEKIVRGFGDSRLRYFPHQASGINANWTHAMRQAVAPYVLKLDDDDYIRPGFLAATCDFLDAHPHVSIVFCAWVQKLRDKPDVVVIDRDFFRDRDVVPGLEYARALLLNLGYPVNHKSTGVFRRELARQIDFFDRIRVDALWTVAMASLGDVGYIPEPLFVYCCDHPHGTEGMGWRTLKLTMESVPRLFALDSFRGKPEWAAMEAAALSRARITVPLLFWFAARAQSWRWKWRMARQLAAEFPDVSRSPFYWPGVFLTSVVPKSGFEAMCAFYTRSNLLRRIVNALAMLGPKRNSSSTLRPHT